MRQTAQTRLCSGISTEVDGLSYIVPTLCYNVTLVTETEAQSTLPTSTTDSVQRPLLPVNTDEWVSPATSYSSIDYSVTREMWFLFLPSTTISVEASMGTQQEDVTKNDLITDTRVHITTMPVIVLIF